MLEVYISVIYLQSILVCCLLIKLGFIVIVHIHHFFKTYLYRKIVNNVNNKHFLYFTIQQYNTIKKTSYLILYLSYLTIPLLLNSHPFISILTISYTKLFYHNKMSKTKTNITCLIMFHYLCKNVFGIFPLELQNITFSG